MLEARLEALLGTLNDAAARDGLPRGDGAAVADRLGRERRAAAPGLAALLGVPPAQLARLAEHLGAGPPEAAVAAAAAVSLVAAHATAPPGLERLASTPAARAAARAVSRAAAAGDPGLRGAAGAAALWLLAASLDALPGPCKYGTQGRGIAGAAPLAHAALAAAPGLAATLLRAAAGGSPPHGGGRGSEEDSAAAAADQGMEAPCARRRPNIPRLACLLCRCADGSGADKDDSGAERAQLPLERAPGGAAGRRARQHCGPAGGGGGPRRRRRLLLRGLGRRGRACGCRSSAQRGCMRRAAGAPLGGGGARALTHPR
jgi:hypothetical protein